MTTRTGNFLAFLLVMWPMQGAAQPAPVIELAPAEAVSEVEFTSVRSIREVADGSLLVTDRIEVRLIRLTWEPGGETIIGRVGQGPREYRGLGGLFALPGDSTLMMDTYHGRWSLVLGAEIVETVGQSRPLPTVLAHRVLGVDDSGHVLGFKELVPRGRRASATTSDSIALILGDRATGTVDTVARVKNFGGAGFEVLPPSRGRLPLIVGMNPLDTRDEAILLADGWIAVARADDYRVDWRDPNGTWHRGPPLPFERRQVDERERCAAIRRFMSANRRCDETDLPGWPEYVPPFVWERIGVVFAAPGGGIAIARTPAVDSRERLYDLVDRSGRLTGILSLDSGRRLIGFGRNSVYVLSKDEFDLETIARHPW